MIHYDIDEFVRGISRDVVEWYYNDFEIGKKYNITISKFPKHTTLMNNEHSNYLVFEGKVENEGTTYNVKRMMISEKNFLQALTKSNLPKMEPNKHNVSFILKRLSQKKLRLDFVGFEE